MQLFKIKNGNVVSIEKDPFKLEKDIQFLVEENLETFFKLEFVSTEFRVGDFRLDSLAYDKETNSFVIVEYKKGASYSVVDQGYSYLSVMLNNKAEFILEYNEKTGKQLKRDKVDWTSSRVIFVSSSFNTYQRNSVNFRDVPFELWEIKKNLALEALRKLINGEIKSKLSSRVVKTKAFSERLSEAINRYHTNALMTAQVLEELIALAKEIRAEMEQSGKDGLSEDEVAFYEALSENVSAVDLMGDEKLKLIAHELLQSVRSNATVDWHHSEMARAKIRVSVKRILKKYGYPPDLESVAIKTVLQQAEAFSEKWAA